MQRSSLPQNYVLNNGILLEGFESTSAWVHIYGGTIVDNPAEHKTGSQSMKFSMTNSTPITTSTSQPCQLRQQWKVN